MGRSKTSRFRNMSTKPQYTSSSQAKHPQTKQTTQSSSSIPSNIASGITTGLGMGLGMEAARAASDAIFTNKEQDKPKIVNAHGCEDLFTEFKICMSSNNYVVSCEGILDRYHRCVKNEY